MSKETEQIAEIIHDLEADRELLASVIHDLVKTGYVEDHRVLGKRVKIILNEYFPVEEDEHE